MKLTLTPSKRLARAISRRQTADQVADGTTAWIPEPTLPWSAWVSLMLDDYLIAAPEGHLPLTAEQAHVLWTEIVSHDVLINAPSVAGMAQRAWARMHEWLLPDPATWDPIELPTDAEKFAAWATAYAARLDNEGWEDLSRWQRILPEKIRKGTVPCPSQLTMVGFDLPLTPIQRAIVEALEASGCTVVWENSTASPAVPKFISVPDSESELAEAAAWARTQLDAGMAHVAIVVPDLSTRLDEVNRAMREALRPDQSRLQSGSPARPWHIALGQPLRDHPLVLSCLDLLALNPARMDVTKAGALIRCPFIGGWADERQNRDWLDRDLRRVPGAEMPLELIVRTCKRSGELNQLAQHLEDWKDSRAGQPRKALPSHWARHFCDELAAMSVGAGRGLDSIEYQCWTAWKGVLEQLSSLDLVSHPVSRSLALSWLRELAGSRLFREQNPGAPVEVMTVSEALGGTYDAIWIAGFTESQWPAPAQPDPFLPRRLQSECPDATADGQVGLARATLNGLLRTAPNVSLSWPTSDGDSEVRGSTLLGPVSDTNALPRPEPARPELTMEHIESDAAAPPFPARRVPGGVRPLWAQSACPFRAVAETRLGADEIQHPRPGLSPMDRGSLLHKALEIFWRGLDSSQMLHSLAAEALEDRVTASAQAAVEYLVRKNPLLLSDSLRTLEQERLAGRLRAWIELEKVRPAFRVQAVESPLTITISGLDFQVKPDRIDELESGETLPIDYKSGATKVGDWFPHGRLVEPQLPAYTLALDKVPAGLAFGSLKPSGLGFAGLSGASLDIPGISSIANAKRTRFSEYESWGQLVADWKTAVGDLAQEFRDGVASVRPRDKKVCERCHLQALCRIAERTDGGA